MRLSHTLITSLALGLASLPALAQTETPPPPRGEGGAPPPGGPGGAGGRGGGTRAGMPQLSPEQLKSAYEAEARHVSKSVGLTEDETGKVVTAYQAARESQSKALEEMRAKMRDAAGGAGGAGGAGAGGGEGGGAGGAGGGGGGAPRGGGAMAEEMQKALADINKSEKDKFQTALNGFLKPDQTEKVIAPLGNFDRQWDQITVAIVELKLDADKQDQALGISQEYVATLAKNRENPDRTAMREANVAARTKMNDEMKKILDEEQFGKFQRASGGQGRGGQGGAGGAGGAAGGERGRPRGGAGGAGGGDGGGAGGAGGGGNTGG